MSKALIEAYMDAVWNKKQIDVVPRVVKNDAIIHAALGTFYGAKAMQFIIQSWQNAFPDLHLTILHTVAEKEMIVTHWNVKATHTGEFFQIPASNNKMNVSGITMYRMSDSMIAEYWAYTDLQTMRMQMLAK